jgi:carboxyl-terminal processing protease
MGSMFFCVNDTILSLLLKGVQNQNFSGTLVGETIFETEKLMRILLATVAAGLFLSSGAFAQSEKKEPEKTPLTPAQQLEFQNKKYQSLESLSLVLNLLETRYVDENSVASDILIERAIKGVVNGLDPHTLYLPPQDLRDFQSDTAGRFGGVGLVINQTSRYLEIADVLPDSPAAKAGVKSGDVLYGIDRETITKTNAQELLNRIRGLAGTELDIELIPAAVAVREKLNESSQMYPLTEFKNKTKKITIRREVIHTSSVSKASLSDGYGYIRISIFQEDTGESVDKAITDLEDAYGGKLKGLVLDLRDNPGGLFDQAVRIADLFLDSGIIVSTIGRQKSAQSVEYATKRDTHPNSPIVVLINEKSASASEILAGALQDHNRAVVMGVTSFGKGSVQQIVQLPNGGGLKLTIARYYTPKGKSIQAKGIIPDVVLENPNPSQGKESKKKSPKKEADLAGHIDASDLQSAEQQPAISSQIEKWADKLKKDESIRSAYTYLKGWERFQK